MNWEDHSRDVPRGKHALFSGSNYAWTNISMEDESQFEEAMRLRYYNSFAKDVGTIIHEWAADRIKYRANVTKSDSKGLLIYIIKTFENELRNYIPRSVAQYFVDKCFPNVMSYVKDAIGFRLDPEVMLMYSDEFFGTADAILFREGQFLRVHDLKTGTTPTSLRQLEIYAAFCCLEYGVDPEKLEIELRIYQNDEILVGNPPGSTIKELMDRIRKTRTVFDKIRKEG